MMTFHESYGHLPMRLLRLYKQVNVSPADHDTIMDRFGFSYDTQESIPAETWERISEFVTLSSTTGSFRTSLYL